MTFIRVFLGALALASVTIFSLVDDVEVLTRYQIIKILAGCTTVWAGVLLVMFLLIEAAV